MGSRFRGLTFTVLPRSKLVVCSIAAVPDEYCDEGALVGSPERIRQRYKEWEGAGVTGLTLSCRRLDGLELLAELSGSRDRAS